MPTPPLFSRYIGIDYSGAKTPVSSLTGLRIYSATASQPPAEVLPPPGSRKYWTRRGIAEWLVTELREGPPTLVGMDHAFSFPLRYFQEIGFTSGPSTGGRPRPAFPFWRKFILRCGTEPIPSKTAPGTNTTPTP